MRKILPFIAVIIFLGVFAAVILSVIRQPPAPAFSFSFIGYSNGMSYARFSITNGSRHDIFVHPFAVIQTNAPSGWTKASVEWWRGDQESLRLEPIESFDEKVVAFPPPAGHCRWRVGIRLESFHQLLLSEL